MHSKIAHKLLKYKKYETQINKLDSHPEKHKFNEMFIYSTYSQDHYTFIKRYHEQLKDIA